MFSLARGATLSLVVISGACARYNPEPFDPAEHRSRWFERGPAMAEAADFARALGEAAPEAKSFDPADGLTLGEAELAGLVYNGGLRAARARLKIAEASAEHAGILPDPTLNLGLQRILNYSAEPWIAAADAAFSLPLWGTLSAEQARAENEFFAAAWRTAAEERKFILELRFAWIEWSSCAAKAREATRQIEAIDRVIVIVKTIEDAGEIRRTDARLFSIERAKLDLNLHHFTHEAEEHVTRIKVLIGLRPESPAALREGFGGDATGAEVRAAEEEVRLVEGHPMMRAAHADYDEAERALERAAREAIPAPEAGPSFESDEGSDRVGANASLQLPLWNRNRRAIAEAEAARAAAKVALEAEAERLAGELVLARAKVHASEVDWRMTVEHLAPLADEQLGEARALAELGELDALLLLEAFKQSYEAKIAIVDARAELARANAELANLTEHDAPTMLKEMLREKTN